METIKHYVMGDSQVIQLDVNDDKSVTDAINRIAKEMDRTDVVINNAGRI